MAQLPRLLAANEARRKIRLVGPHRRQPCSEDEARRIRVRQLPLLPPMRKNRANMDLTVPATE